MNTKPETMNTTNDSPENPDKNCRECGQPFKCDFPAVARFVHVCPVCSERHAAQGQQRAVVDASAARRTRWQSFCPPAYLTTD
ncbi:MAG: hypothetical protein ABMA26_12125, partial [Limisphaerales bacterium]